MRRAIYDTLVDTGENLKQFINPILHLRDVNSVCSYKNVWGRWGA